MPTPASSAGAASEPTATTESSVVPVPMRCVPSGPGLPRPPGNRGRAVPSLTLDTGPSGAGRRPRTARRLSLPTDVFVTVLTFLSTDTACTMSRVCSEWEHASRVRRGCWLAAPAGDPAFITCVPGELVSGRVMGVALGALQQPELSATDLCLKDDGGRVAIALQINATYGICSDPDQEIGVGDIAVFIARLPVDLGLPVYVRPPTRCLPAWGPTRRSAPYGPWPGAAWGAFADRPSLLC